jgi:hypothetical protein
MTYNEFLSACVTRTILPEIALENENLKAALRVDNDDEVIRILDNEF